MSTDEQTYIQALALGLDPAWRRRTDEERHDDGCRFAEAAAAAELDGVRSISYSSIGLEPGVDLLFWRMAPSVDALESAAAALLRAGLGRWWGFAAAVGAFVAFMVLGATVIATVVSAALLSVVAVALFKATTPADA